MIVCKNCGHQNEDNDTFCGSCGKFLEWTGERVVVAEPEPPAPPPPAPEPEPAHVGFIDRVKQAVGIEETQPQAPSSAEPTAPAPTSVRTVPITSAAPSMTRPPAPTPPITSAPVASTPAPPIAAETVAAPEPVLAGVGAPIAPVAPGAATPAQSDEPMSRRPTSVAPTIARPRQAPRTMEPPTRRRPGDLICGNCGEGNDPIRHFCRRCGNSLDEAIAVRLPWYRRFFNRLFGVRAREAGWRPKRVGAPNVMGGFMRIVRLALGAILVIALLAFALVPQFRTTVINRVTALITPVRIALFPHYSQIHATGWSASTAIAGHGPDLAVDTFSNTYWGSSPRDTKPYLKVTFKDPVDIAQIGFRSGASGTAPTDQFALQPRPRQVHLVFSDGVTVTLNLKDDDPKLTKTAQFYPIDNAKDITFVEVHIDTTYATAGAAPSSVAISEIVFMTRD